MNKLKNNTSSNLFIIHYYLFILHVPRSNIYGVPLFHAMASAICRFGGFFPKILAWAEPPLQWLRPYSINLFPNPGFLCTCLSWPLLGSGSYGLDFYEVKNFHRQPGYLNNVSLEIFFAWPVRYIPPPKKVGPKLGVLPVQQCRLWYN